MKNPLPAPGVPTDNRQTNAGIIKFLHITQFCRQNYDRVHFKRERVKNQCNRIKYCNLMLTVKLDADIIIHRT
jgi:hypothetical protein